MNTVYLMDSAPALLIGVGFLHACFLLVSGVVYGFSLYTASVAFQILFVITSIGLASWVATGKDNMLLGGTIFLYWLANLVLGVVFTSAHRRLRYSHWARIERSLR